jgi:hypothetical protein
MPIPAPRPAEGAASRREGSRTKTELTLAQNLAMTHEALTKEDQRDG